MQLSILIFAAIAAAAAVYNAATQPRRTNGGSRQGRLFVDTSVLIDGRIVEIAKSGFLTDTLAIPRSVVGELQLLADKGDTEKRTKARSGLDVITELQDLSDTNVEIFADNPTVPEGVDSRLVQLAKDYNGRLCTVDYNLNKVATVEGIVVCNVNELAKNLRMTYLPGETAKLALTDKGQNSRQAVGHLDDGTMVVVEQAAGRVGAVVEVEFIRSLQTDAGRMMFARLKSEPQASVSAPTQPRGGKAARTKTVKRSPIRRKTQKAEKPEKTESTPKTKRQKPQEKTKTSSGTKDRKAQGGSARPSRPRKARRTNEDRLVDLANK